MRLLLIVVLLVAACSRTGEETAMESFFCPADDCLSRVSSLIGNATEATCALYNYDAQYVVGAAVISTPSGNGLMHHKFCVLDGKSVLTGSFNPVEAAANDANNVLVLHDKAIARAYALEAQQVRQQEKKASRKTFSEGRIEVYFCPQDSCALAVTSELATAERTVLFAAFTFTHPAIATELILAAHRNVSVTGTVDGREPAMPHTQYHRLRSFRVDVLPFHGNGRMHHKVFVIDNRTVITGSFNPTKNADERNDENVLIVHDNTLAARYAEEIMRLLQEEEKQ